MRDVVVDRDRSGVAKLGCADAARENAHARHAGAFRGLDVPHGVTDEDRTRRSETGLVESCLHEVGIGLRRVDVVLARDLVDRVVGVDRLTQVLDLLGRCAGRQDDSQPRLLRRTKEVGSAWKRNELAQVGAVVVGVRVRDGVVSVTEHGLDELIRALAHRAMQRRHGHLVAIGAQRLRPRDHVQVVGVDERAVDIEEHAGGVGTSGHDSRRTRQPPERTRFGS